MELEVFAGQEKSELSMIEVARAILESRGDVYKRQEQKFRKKLFLRLWKWAPRRQK